MGDLVRSMLLLLLAAPALAFQSPGHSVRVPIVAHLSPLFRQTRKSRRLSSSSQQETTASNSLSDLLLDCPLFEGLSDVQPILDRLTPVDIKEGEHLVEEGQKTDALYFVASGSLEVIQGGEAVEELGTSDCFGADSLFVENTSRVAVRVVDPATIVYQLSAVDLEHVLKDVPELGSSIQALEEQYEDSSLRDSLVDSLTAAATPTKKKVSFHSMLGTLWVGIFACA